MDRKHPPSTCSFLATIIEPVWQESACLTLRTDRNKDTSVEAGRKQRHLSHKTHDPDSVHGGRTHNNFLTIYFPAAFQTPIGKPDLACNGTQGMIRANKARDQTWPASHKGTRRVRNVWSKTFFRGSKGVSPSSDRAFILQGRAFAERRTGHYSGEGGMEVVYAPIGKHTLV